MEKTVKVVINVDFGAFGLTDAALAEYNRRKGGPEQLSCWDIDRSDPVLVEVVEVAESLGDRIHRWADGRLKIVEVPADVDWTIKDYDGAEWVAEVHRTWS